MKKVYEKPQVYMERFELAEHIASGCGMIIPARGDICFNMYPGMFDFSIESSCKFADESNETYCVYKAVNNPLFTS